MLIQIDPTRERFLGDHVVGETPLLPTVMALDLLVRAASVGQSRAETVVVRDLEVGPPIRVINAVPVGLRVMVDEPVDSGSRVCELVAAGTGAPHYRAVIETHVRPIRNTLSGPAWPARWAVRPELVYPPFFHGPTFQVVGGLTRVAGGVVASMANDLPTLGWSSVRLQLRPRLLELFMQGCGLAAFAASGRMMIPSRIDLMTWHAPGLRPVAGAAEGPAVAHISPRVGAADDGLHTAVYDGLVVARNGQALLTVRGYRAVDLGVPRDLHHASVLRTRLDDDPIAAMLTTAVLPQPEGVRP